MRVVGDYTWALKLGNGLESKWTAKTNESGELIGESEWFKAGKLLGKYPLQFHVSEDEVDVEVERNQDDVNAVLSRVEVGARGPGQRRADEAVLPR